MGGLEDVESVTPTACGNQVLGIRFPLWSFRSDCKRQVSFRSRYQKGWRRSCSRPRQMRPIQSPVDSPDLRNPAGYGAAYHISRMAFKDRSYGELASTSQETHLVHQLPTMTTSSIHRT